MKARASPPLSRWTSSNGKSCFFSARSRRKTSDSLSSTTSMRAARTTGACSTLTPGGQTHPAVFIISHLKMPPLVVTPISPNSIAEAEARRTGARGEVKQSEVHRMRATLPRLQERTAIADTWPRVSGCHVTALVDRGRLFPTHLKPPAAGPTFVSAVRGPHGLVVHQPAPEIANSPLAGYHRSALRSAPTRDWIQFMFLPLPSSPRMTLALARQTPFEIKRLSR